MKTSEKAKLWLMGLYIYAIIVGSCLADPQSTWWMAGLLGIPSGMVFWKVSTFFKKD